MDRERIQAFMERFVKMAAGATTIGLLAIADRSGLNQFMADHQPRTVAEIVAGAGLEPRYVEEVLSGLAAAGVYDYDAATRQFWMAPEHAVFVAQESSPYFMGGWFDIIPSMYEQIDELVEASRAGGGVPFEQFGPGMIRGIARGNAPAQEILLVSKWLPGVTGLVERLESGIRAADVGCGSGSAITTMARAYPASQFVGYDISAEQIAIARQRGEDTPNLTFELARVEELSATSGFDLITSFDVIHDLADPEVGLNRIHRALADGGQLFMMEPAAGSNLEENLTPRGALLYGVSAMHCMTQSLARGGKGVGAAWGRQAIEQTARRAGFGTVTRLGAISNTFSDFFLMDH